MRSSPCPLLLAALVVVLAGFSACGPTPVDANLAGTDVNATFADDGFVLAFENIDVAEDQCPTLSDDSVTFVGGTHEVISDCAARTLSVRFTQSGAAAPVEGEDEPVEHTVVIESGGGTATWGAAHLDVKRRFVRADSLEQVPRGLTLRVNFEPFTDALDDPDTVELRDGDDALALTYRLDGNAIAIDVPSDAEPGPQTLAVSGTFTVPTTTCEGFASCAAGGTREEIIDLTIAP